MLARLSLSGSPIHRTLDLVSFAKLAGGKCLAQHDRKQRELRGFSVCLCC
jgi:hypothetical protein